MKEPVILIVVEGGVVSDVYSDSPAKVIIKDWDNIEAGDKLNPVPRPITQVSETDLKAMVASNLEPDQLEPTNADADSKS